MIIKNYFINRNKSIALINKSNNSKKIYLTEKSIFDKNKNKYSKKILNWMNSNSYASKVGEVLCVPDENFNIKYIFAGISKIFSVWDIAKIFQKLPQGNYTLEVNESLLKKYAIVWSLENYKFTYFSKNLTKEGVKNLIINNKIYRDVKPLIEGCYLARDLINMPANHLNPENFQKIVYSLAKEHKAKLTVSKNQSLKKNYPLVHFVGRASEIEPRLIDLEWNNNKSYPNLILVGKGVTFDSGGLDLKSPGGMEIMKKDMAGAAIAIGLGHAIMMSNLKINLRILLPTVENSVSEKSMRPLDIVKSASGINVEIGNTDAEGRLILADSLYHASISKQSDLIIDLATLTGAARVALGTELPAIFSNNKLISKKIIDLGEDCEDPLWELPLHNSYNSSLDLNVDLISNVGSSSYGGAITAALFLSRFIKNKTNWVHIDLMGWNSISKPGRPKGGEAMTLRTLFEYISREFKKY